MNRETQIMPQNTRFNPLQSEQDPVSEEMVVQMLQKGILTAWLIELVAYLHCK